MKKLLTIFTLSLFAQLTFGQNGCNDSVPNWGESLGVVSFKTNQTWIVGNQEWSDVVMATACRKEIFNGGDVEFDGKSTETYAENFKADCRSNPNFGDLFSWCAVIRFQKQLCLAPWRVPEHTDFEILDIALGGTGEDRKDIPFINKNYINPTIWGGTYGGGCISGTMLHQNSEANYWSLSDGGFMGGFYLTFHSSGYIDPLSYTDKTIGYMLRCVRDKSK
jgi:uncharacterized protein (TIGR02145 family)